MKVLIQRSIHACGVVMRTWNLVIVFLTKLWATFAAITANLMLCFLGCRSAKEAPETISTGPADKGDITTTIVYDNNPGVENLTPAWGFACVVELPEKTILFDTGGDGRTLLGNMRQLGVEAKQIDAIVLSHIHGDHTGGLSSVLRIRSGIKVYIPTGFPSASKEQIQSLGAEPIEAEESELVCQGVRTTGTLGKGAIEEQGLCINTRDGWVLITGCAHPGVANMVAQAKQATDGQVSFVMGGFHMGSQSKSQIEAVIDRFSELGVRQVAPCHCSGERARKLFKRHFGDGCKLAGVGYVFSFRT